MEQLRHVANSRSAGFTYRDVGKGREQERKLRLHAQAELALPLHTVAEVILCSFLTLLNRDNRSFAHSPTFRQIGAVGASGMG